MIDEDSTVTLLLSPASEARNILEIVEDRDDSSPRFPLTEEFQAAVAPCGATPPLPARPLPPLGDQSYEEGEPCGPMAPCPTDGLDSDESLYESYGDEEACAARGTDSLQALPAPSLTHICGLLWRKQWLGRWSRQLVLIKGQLLLCYKCLADGLPLLEMSLAGARAAYKFKWGRRVEHELKVTGTAHASLVLGLHTQRQAHDWMKVWRLLRM
ncbi:actin filament-associated protein 1-like 2 isoform X2 [Leucoraja erinacea]|uniref:actin filament-associated protein 1-like 2 isoform X2 n=1 Tax=Leucoraja erinaceus TaxID=7782 RepID=UPI0024570858|nr:actin filament-associated protein 1-like 2 isoform X2 [Leucoraja erinacea]